MAFRFSPGHSLQSGVADAVREQINRGIRVASDSHRSIDGRIHAARTACKKIRATLRLACSKYPAVWKREDAWFRDCARDLAPWREAAVMPVTLRALIAHSGDATEQRKFEPVRRALLARQREMMADPAVVRRALGRFETRLRRAAQRLEKWRIKFSDSGAIDDGFGESYRRARRAWRRANVDRSTSAFHAWRKRAKMHAYQQRLFRAAWPAMMRAWQIELTALTDLLGDEHDLAVLDEYLADVAVKRIEPTVIRALRHRIETQRDELRLQAAALGGRLFAEKASRVTRRLKIWWRLAA